MKTCKRCTNELEDKFFRTRKNKKGNYYTMSICTFCDRRNAKSDAKKRYDNFTLEQKKEYFNKSKTYQKSEKYKLWRNNWRKEKEKTDVLFLLTRRVGALLRNSINKNSETLFSILGYSSKELKQYIESKFEPWMNWNNWGVYNPNNWDNNDCSTWKWQIDHIKPINSFNYKDKNDKEFKECWALENLRPLSAKENILKRDKII
jgi:hypothetical protein